METSDEEEEGKERDGSNISGVRTPQAVSFNSERIVLSESAVSIRLSVQNLTELPSTYEFSDYHLRFEYDGDEG